MKLNMIVLREKPQSPREVELVAVARKAGVPMEQPVELEIRPTELADAESLRNEKGVIAIAPPMPVALIKSFAATAGAIPAAPKSNWGIEAVNAAASPFTGAGVTVAVLDTGIEKDHPAFSGVALELRNFTTGPDRDTDSHGTHCAGTIFGRDVGGKRIGIARGVKRALIGKVIGDGGGSTENIVRAIHWALSENAHVISMSLGMDFVGYQQELMQKYGLPEPKATSMALAGYRDNVRLFDKMSNLTSGRQSLFNSSIVVAAAGNESDRPQYAISVSPPAAAELFISVSAVALEATAAPAYRMAPFSNDGATFAAPGVDIWSASLGGGLVSSSGTSMAAPHVAGVAALWSEKLLKDGRFNAAAAIDMMIKNSKPLPNVTSSDAQYGMIQAPL